MSKRPRTQTPEEDNTAVLFFLDEQAALALTGYAGWVAVYNQRVVAEAPDFDSIVQAVRDFGCGLENTYLRNCGE